MISMDKLEIVEIEEIRIDQITVPHCHHRTTPQTFAWK
ncbi:hypothetical protein HMPREF0578_0506 [Mobiluncus mulieris 28-1]|nr:hypothetical protein HMPREF0578_0506 [Mobiluncus mulieris 28-1]